MRTRITCFLSCLVAGVVFPAAAQDAPPKLIRIVVPFGPGGSNDLIARAIAQPLAKRLETTVIVENRAGAGGTIGADAVTKGPKDGSMLLLTSSTLLTTAATQPRVPYNVLTAFMPISVVAQNPSILAVSPGTPFKSVRDVIAAARAKPNWLTYGSAGVGSIGHLVTELIMSGARIEMRHIPYTGAAPAAIDLARGEIDIFVSSVATLSPFVKAGKVRMIAVSSPQAHPALPNLPPIAATVPGIVNETWAGVLAPAGVSARFIERVNRDINEIAGSPELRTVFEPDAMLPAALTPAQFAERINRELTTWKEIATRRKIVTE